MQKRNTAIELLRGVTSVILIFFSQGRFLSIYVGNGLKYETTTYYPINPPKIMDDPLEFEEQPEPTPLNEPPKEEEVNDSQ